MSTLPTNLRRQLEEAAKKARNFAKTGAWKALEALAVHEPDPYNFMKEDQRDLRRKLRAQARQLGDNESLARPGVYEISHLIEKIAYDQWHRILFARFLLENNLLISPEHRVSVTLDDCEELAQSMALKDAWAVAARFASKELPEIFRADDPAGAVELPVEDRNPLIQLVEGLPREVFTASDSLGWCYQFWQADRKDEVNASGSKIGADELPAVTQLFTEDYMVDFLLDNTLGTWHAGKVLAANSTLTETAQSEEELRNAVALPRCPWKYLRFVKADDGKWRPAAGNFDGWPKTAREITCLDPCMGSGHFVVAMFERLVALRLAEESLDESEAALAVIRENLFGLEIDPRCTQIAAFNLALAAWRRVGHCALPPMNLACSGLAPNAKEEDWVKLAGDSMRLQNGMKRLYHLFKDAPVLGSLINPTASRGDLLISPFQELRPLLGEALARESNDATAHELVVTASGLAKAAELLARSFTLIATNVPYLGRGKQTALLQDYCEHSHSEAKADLATCFVERCMQFCDREGGVGLVTPQNWLFIKSYSSFRKRVIREHVIRAVSHLGSAAFQTISGEVVVASMLVLSRRTPGADDCLTLSDVSEAATVKQKAELMRHCEQRRSNQIQLLANPDYRVAILAASHQEFLKDVADVVQGMSTGDNPQFQRNFWEADSILPDWRCLEGATERPCDFGGKEHVVWMRRLEVEGELYGAALRGKQYWGKQGISTNRLGQQWATRYLGNPFDINVNLIIPKIPADLEAIYEFCRSPEFNESVRELDKKTAVTNATIGEIPFDLSRWSQRGQSRESSPKPYSSDPRQWIFGGHPKDSDQPLHVAIARLLGYQWPRQTGSSFPNCPALEPDGLEQLADEDGIVCVSATKGEESAAERLRSLLANALGNFEPGALISRSGPKGGSAATLEEWLRDEFFEQHCALFHHRPFIWHIWDGNKNGFSALVNYPKLTHANLEKLTYAYLGDWIRRQQAAVEVGEAGSDARLQAARQLQARLKLILEGEPPYDIFVRWKPLARQAIGWHPDLNDGVRMNIRPFLAQDIPGGKKGAGILRAKPNIKWGKDRGKEPRREKKDFPWFWAWDEQKQDFAGIGNEPDGNRWNGCHYTNEFKKKAREGK